MKSSRSSFNQFQNWQGERAKVLHRACLSVQRAIQRGAHVGAAIARVSRRLHGRPFKCDPARHLPLSPKTLRRVWDLWRRGGQVPAAVRLNYAPRRRRIAAHVLIRFLNFCADRDFKSLRAAWQAFCDRGGNAGPGRVKLTYDSLRWNLPRGCFAELKKWREAKRLAEVELNKARLRFIAEILALEPAKLPRRKPTDFQI